MNIGLNTKTWIVKAAIVLASCLAVLALPGSGPSACEQSGATPSIQGARATGKFLVPQRMRLITGFRQSPIA